MPIQVYLGVGLHNGYGSAQRMYVKEVIFPMVREYGIRIKYAHPMIQFILTMMTLFFIFQRKYVRFNLSSRSLIMTYYLNFSERKKMLCKNGS